jgi:hypothetical protein
MKLSTPNAATRAFSSLLLLVLPMVFGGGCQNNVAPPAASTAAAPATTLPEEPASVDFRYVGHPHAVAASAKTGDGELFVFDMGAYRIEGSGKFDSYLVVGQGRRILISDMSDYPALDRLQHLASSPRDDASLSGLSRIIFEAAFISTTLHDLPIAVAAGLNDPHDAPTARVLGEIARELAGKDVLTLKGWSARGSVVAEVRVGPLMREELKRTIANPGEGKYHETQVDEAQRLRAKQMTELLDAAGKVLSHYAGQRPDR